jgi:non-ribosomal peptide synthetase component E (peptide arylation enzyme)
MQIGEQAAYVESVGRPVAYAHIVEVDDNGREVSPDETGELLIDGPMVVPGYSSAARLGADRGAALSAAPRKRAECTHGALEPQANR